MPDNVRLADRFDTLQSQLKTFYRLQSKRGYGGTLPDNVRLAYALETFSSHLKTHFTDFVATT